MSLEFLIYKSPLPLPSIASDYVYITHFSLTEYPEISFPCSCPPNENKTKQKPSTSYLGSSSLSPSYSLSPGHTKAISGP